MQSRQASEAGSGLSEPEPARSARHSSTQVCSSLPVSEEPEPEPEPLDEPSPKMQSQTCAHATC